MQKRGGANVPHRHNADVAPVTGPRAHHVRLTEAANMGVVKVVPPVV